VGGAIRRMINRKLSQAFEKWQAEAASMKAQKHAVGGAIRRMINRKLSQAFEKWQAEAASQMASQLLMRHAVIRMVKRHLGNVFAQWRQCAWHDGRQRSLMLHAITSALRWNLARSMRYWIESVKLTKYRRDLIRMTIIRVVSRRLQAAMLTWRTFAYEASGRLWQMRGAVDAYTHRYRMKCIRQWQWVCSDMAFLSIKLQSALLCIRHGQLKKSMRTWHENAVIAAAQKALQSEQLAKLETEHQQLAHDTLQDMRRVNDEEERFSPLSEAERRKREAELSEELESARRAQEAEEWAAQAEALAKNEARRRKDKADNWLAEKKKDDDVLVSTDTTGSVQRTTRSQNTGTEIDT